MRKVVLAAVIVASALFGMVVPSVAAAEVAGNDAKIVIIVGADTPQYIDDANELFAEAIKHTSNVLRVYSPNATWAAVKAATVGANVVIYLGHGNGWPSPYTYDPKYASKDGFGLDKASPAQCVSRTSLEYCGEPYIRTLQLAPGAVVFLHHLCYASGNSEPGGAAPSLTVAKQRADNYASAFLAAGASAVIADGHSHTGYYLNALFTSAESLADLWRGAPDYHGHDIAFAPTRSTGEAVLDPDTGGAGPSGYYRSIVGDLSFMTHNVIGVKLPPGARGDPGVSVVPDRPPEGAGPATTPRSIQIGGPRPIFTARTATYPMRRSGAPATLK